MTREQLDSILRHAVILGALAVLLVPAARGSSAWFGWLPLWLVGMPLAAWWSLRGFPLPQVAVRVPRRDDLWCEPISKVLLRHPYLSDDELASAARMAVGSLATVTMSGPGTVELQPCGITKATGLALAADHLGLTPDETIAFGDMPNDIPMFDWAAHGVAMANAHPELKAVADEVTLSNEDDGIAVVLDRLFR